MTFENTPAGMFPVTTEAPSSSVYLVIPGKPVSKERPRFTKTGRTYTPTKTATAEKAIAKLYSTEYPDVQLEGALSVTITCFVPDRIRRDVDNMGKLILDALNGLAFADDSQIHDLVIYKRYTTKERTRSEVTIRQMNQYELENDHYVEQEVSQVSTDWETIEEVSRKELPAGS